MPAKVAKIKQNPGKLSTFRALSGAVGSRGIRSPATGGQSPSEPVHTHRNGDNRGHEQEPCRDEEQGEDVDKTGEGNSGRNDPDVFAREWAGLGGFIPAFVRSHL